MRIRPTDQESILNISHSKLYDVYRRLFRNQPGAYQNISPNQSDQEYVNIPRSEGYVHEIYEDSVPGNFATESKYEPYEPQFVEFVRTLIQKAPMIQSVIEQTPELKYNPVIEKFIFELFLEASKLRMLEEQSINNTRQDAEPISEPDLSSIAERIMPEAMSEHISDMPNLPEMPDIEPMEERNSMMDLEMMIDSAMPDSMPYDMPGQMPEMAEMDQMQEQKPEPEQQMTLEMLINSLFLSGGQG